VSLAIGGRRGDRRRDALVAALVLEDFRIVDFTGSVPSLSSAPAFLAAAGLNRSTL
jgi:hypothetical protein